MCDASSGAMKFKEKQSFALLFITLKSQNDNIVHDIHKCI